MLLTELLEKGQKAIAATSTLIGMGMLPQKLDATGVDILTDEQLEALFSGIPQEWEFVELAEKVFNIETFRETLANQFPLGGSRTSRRRHLGLQMA